MEQQSGRMSRRSFLAIQPGLRAFAAVLALVACWPTQAAGLLQFAACGDGGPQIEVSADGRVHQAGRPLRALEAAQLEDLLAAALDATGRMDQRRVEAAANPAAAGLMLTDRPCFNLKLRLTGQVREVRWNLIPEPWNLASLKLYRLEQSLFGLAQVD